MKILTVLLLLCALTGCWREVNRWEIERAEKVCETHGGVDHIVLTLRGGIRCIDGYYATM